MENRLIAQATHCAMGTVMTHKAFGLHAEDSLSCLQKSCADRRTPQSFFA
jgi:hypothetical protein